MNPELLCPNCKADLYFARWMDEPIGLAKTITFLVQCDNCGKKIVIWYSNPSIQLMEGK